MPLDNRTYAIIGLGTSLGVLIMFVVMIPSLRKTGFKLYLGINLRDPELHKMLKLAFPMILYVICNLITVSVRNAAAASVSIDAQAMVRFASIWQSLPYGIIAVSITTAIFTELAKAATDEDMLKFKTSLVSGLRLTTIFMLPASALLFGLAEPLVSFFVAGRFMAGATAPIASVLQIWALSLVFFAGSMYVLRAFYSVRDTWTPTLTKFGCGTVQVIGYLLLTGAILPAGMGALGINGIPVADGIFFFIFFAALLILLRRKIGSFDIRQFVVVFAKMLVVSVVVGAMSLYGSQYLTGLLGTGHVPTLLIVLICGAVGIVITYIGARLLGVDEVDTFATKIRRKFAKTKTSKT